MKLLMVQIILLLTTISAANANGSVSTCTFDAMKVDALEGLKAKIVNAMSRNSFNPIIVKPEDIQIESKGDLIFQEQYNLGSQLEHAYSVKFKSVNGTEFTAISTFNEPMCESDDLVFNDLIGRSCYSKPTDFLVSIPNPKIYVRNDNEGNEVARFCVVSLYGKYNRDVVFFNSKTQVVLQAIYAPSEEPLAVSEIK